LSVPDENEKIQPPKSLGGWLIIPLAGVILTFFRQINALPFVLSQLRSDNWHRLTSPVSAEYHQLWAPWLVWNVIENLSLIVFAIVIVYCVHKRKQTVQELMVCWCVLAGGLSILVEGAFGHFLYSTPWFDKVLVLKLIVVCIWTLYFLKSRRVKATFVN
jgi:hypothetical protein